MNDRLLEPRFDQVECQSPVGMHRMEWAQWGDPDNPKVLVCAHGLTRTGRDFDTLARAMSDQYRVICPDIVGRGRSDWLARTPEAAQHYAVPQYVADCAAMLAHLGAEQVHWVGTSMGGLIGMGLAALENSPISRLVLNDVGPVLKADALARIGDYVGADIRFATFEDGVQYVRMISESFGPHTDDEWRSLCEYVVVERVTAQGRTWRFHYDPRIGEAFRMLAAANPTGADLYLWDIYDAIHCPTLVIRGAQSDLLDAQTFSDMGRRGPKAELVEFAGIGHAPTLMHDDQVAAVRRFLLA